MTTDMFFENYIVIYAIIEVYPHAMDARVRVGLNVIKVYLH